MCEWILTKGNRKSRICIYYILKGLEACFGLPDPWDQGVGLFSGLPKHERPAQLPIVAKLEHFEDQSPKQTVETVFKANQSDRHPHNDPCTKMTVVQ